MLMWGRETYRNHLICCARTPTPGRWVSVDHRLHILKWQPNHLTGIQRLLPYYCSAKNVAYLYLPSYSEVQQIRKRRTILFLRGSLIAYLIICRYVCAVICTFCFVHCSSIQNALNAIANERAYSAFTCLSAVVFPTPSGDPHHRLLLLLPPSPSDPPPQLLFREAYLLVLRVLCCDVFCKFLQKCIVMASSYMFACLSDRFNS